jgi:exosortase
MEGESLPPGLAEEIAAGWRAVPGKAVFFGSLGAWIALFQFLGNSTFGYIDTPSIFRWLDYSYSQSQDDELGRYVPLIVLGLCWWKRDELLAITKSPWAGGLVFMGVALFLHIVGYAVQQSRLSAVAFFLGVYAMVGIAWGWPMMKATFFPFFLFGFCVPIGTMGETITFPLRLMATTITAWISQYGLGVTLIQKGTQIFDAESEYEYDVAVACAGLRSLTATVALASIYAFVAVEKPWKRVVMIASAFPLAVAGNVLRLTTIIIASEAFGPAAGHWVHDNSVMSLLPYVPAFVGLGALGSWLREREPAAPAPPAAAPSPQLT